MHVGYSMAFQNPENLRGDDEVYANELRLLDLAVDLGFESIWTVEHHFTDYTMCPDPVQFLTYLAAKYPNVRLGTGVIVLPWHDPLRCAEQVALLDNLSGGRMILGIGRGLARVEYEGFRVDMNSSRERFVSSAQMLIEGLERGYVEGTNEFVDQPRRELRPRPQFSFKGRTYAAAVSPESMPIMAELGIGLLVIPQKPWEVVRGDFEVYNRVWAETYGAAAKPPAPLSGGFTFVDTDAERAEDLAYRYIGKYYETVLKHYEFGENPHAGVKGYEFYTGISKYIGRHGREGAVADFVKLMPWGTPDQVIEKTAFIRDSIGIAGFNPGFSYADMPYDVAERSLRLFAAEVLPELNRWETDPIEDGRAPRPAQGARSAGRHRLTCFSRWLRAALDPGRHPLLRRYVLDAGLVTATIRPWSHTPKCAPSRLTTNCAAPASSTWRAASSADSAGAPPRLLAVGRPCRSRASRRGRSTPDRGRRPPPTQAHPGRTPPRPCPAPAGRTVLPRRPARCRGRRRQPAVAVRPRRSRPPPARPAR